MALTPDQWLERLTKRMDLRGDRLRRLRCYMDGDAPLPEGAEGCRDAYKAFQKKARTNFGELVVDAVVERMIPSGFTVNGEANDNDVLRTIWKRNRLQIGIADVLRDMVGLSAGYLIVSEGPGRKALVSCERPEQVITEQAASRPDQVRAGLKVYRDEVDGFDVAFLHPKPGEVHTYYRPLRDALGQPRALVRVQGEWTFAGSAETGLDFIPIFPFVNRGGLGEFETHTDILDRINWNILQRLVITAMQAYRQRATKGDLPVNDENGDEIDYAEMFKPGPGALWQLPEGVELWESQQTDISSILAANKDDITHLAAVTRTPMSTLIPDGANQSAEGASFAKEGLVFKAGDRVVRAAGALDLAMGAALAIETGQSSLVEGVESQWLPVERQSLAERADAATKAQDLPWRTRMTDIWQFSEDRVDQMETERAADALNAQLAQPAPQAAPAQAPMMPNVEPPA
jgi:hypothetical protein